MSSIEDYYRQQIEKAKEAISKINDSDLIGMDTDALVEYHTSRIELPLIEKDNEQEISWEPLKPSVIRTRQYNMPIGRRLHIQVNYPIVQHGKIEDVLRRTSNPYRNTPSFSYSQGSIQFVLDFNPEGGDQSGRISRHIELLEEEIGWKNNNVKTGNENSRRQLMDYIEQNKRRIESDHAFLESIVVKAPIPLVKKENGKYEPVDLSVKKKILPIYPDVKKPTEPTLERDVVEAVIDLINNQGRGFEITPEVFGKLGEEKLRNLILGMLNAVFEGRATGETFVKKGKTDIHLTLEEGGILSAECKIWGGPALYHGTIDQLFRYLTWRQNFGIVITFSKNKGFTSVIEKAKETTLAHPTIKVEKITEKDTSHFISIHTLPEDESKIVTIHHLLFTIYYD